MKITMNNYRLAIALGAYLFCAAASSYGQGAFLLTSGSVGNIDGAGNVDFSLTFNQVPDFFTVDQFGRQANSFQFYIATSPFTGLFPPRPYASLIRGEEIHVAGDLRVRNDSPPDPDPNASGWGSIRGIVPFTLNGQTLTFSVPSSVLNVSGPFAYTLQLTSYGGGTNAGVYPGLSGGPIPIIVPEPTSSWLAAIGAVTIVGLGLTSRRRLLLFPQEERHKGPASESRSAAVSLA